MKQPEETTLSGGSPVVAWGPQRVHRHRGMLSLVGVDAASVIVATLATAGPATAADYYVAPTGSGERCTRATPCELPTGVAKAQAGDTVLLQDGIYRQGMYVANSGRPDAWITFRPDECALPIVEGEGEAALPDESGHYPTGVYVVGEYIRFVGIVSRHWDSGFANVWTGNVEYEGGEVHITPSNGHLEYINCIGDGNHRTAFAMYSANGLLVRESIAAHSGGSPTHSWSSGIQLYAVRGDPGENVVERSVSFENMDAQKNNDGSGFIVDEYTENASFVNNIGFGNGGSCMRLTRSPGTSMSHFSCYHNGRNPTPNSPTDPGEFYFTDDLSRTGTVFSSLLAASGTLADPQVFLHPPAEGVDDNITVNEGAATFFADPEGVNPDFRPPPEAAGHVEDLAVGAAPAVDIGFDPKCIVRRSPEVPYRQSWWHYSVDYDYIRSIGGVAQCFHPKARTGGADMGAYEVSGPPHSFAEPGRCVPSPIEPDPPDDVDAGATAPATTATDDNAPGPAGGNAADGSSASASDGNSAVGSSADGNAGAPSEENMDGSADAQGDGAGSGAAEVADSEASAAQSGSGDVGEAPTTAPTTSVPTTAMPPQTPSIEASDSCGLAARRSGGVPWTATVFVLGATALWRRRR